MKILQFGRSMIEMLGVLAIIAVLSIGGLLGYRRAVNNHQANTILDDANRLAFVILESSQAFQTDDFMEEDFIDSVPYTGTYNLDAFMAAGGQFGIVVTKVPKGVCEALINKASIEYKVRVMPGSEERYSVSQMSNVGTIYDSFHKDICGAENDIVLYFGDTSAQCNKPDEGEDYTKCLSNADCCGGEFCAFENPVNCTDKGAGTCLLISDFGSESGDYTKTVNGQRWIRSSQDMTWWSAENWCKQQNKTLVSRSDLGCSAPCGTSSSTRFCTKEGCQSKSGTAYKDSVLYLLETTLPKWTSNYHWLNDSVDSCYAHVVGFPESMIGSGGRSNRNPSKVYALCH